MEWQKNTFRLHAFIPFAGSSPPGMTLLVLSVQTKQPTYWRWIVPVNNAQMGLGALDKLQLRNKRWTVSLNNAQVGLGALDMLQLRSKRPITY